MEKRFRLLDMNTEKIKQIEALLLNKEWRIKNLYKIKDTKGSSIDFYPNPVQESLIPERHLLNIILKGRQLGVTTYYCIDMLDECLFNSNINAVLIADDLSDAKKLLRDKIRFAYEHLPDLLKRKIQLVNDSTEVMRFSNGSTISVSTSARSGTVQILHITEFGKICRKDPLKAEEIMSGSLNAVHIGQRITIESTAQGSEGHFHKLCTKAMKRERLNEPLTELDFKFHFFPWYDDEKYKMAGDVELIPAEYIRYFKELENNHGVYLSPEQKFWYWKKREEQGDDLMKQEFPSFPDEAFEKSLVGAYWAKEIQQLEKKGRILPMGYDPSYPVHTAWDLGINDTTCIWFFQKIGFDWRIIDYYENSEEALPHYFQIMKEKDYSYGNHYAPHDISKRSFHDGKDGIEVASQYGVRFERIQRPSNKLDSINTARLIFPKCWFDNQNCQEGLQRLRNYRKAWNEKMGRFSDSPLHDINSNGADAFQTFALAANRIDFVQESEQFHEHHEYYDQQIESTNSVTGY